MTNEQIHKPVPVGELLERLHAEGFAIGPGVYDRVFKVVGRIFPDGIPIDVADESTQTLRELIGPIVCRTDTEQEQFAALFNSVMRPDTRQETTSTQTELTENDAIRPSPNPFRYVWLVLAVAAMGVAIGLFFWRYPKEKQDKPPVSTAVNCAVEFGVQATQGDSVTFINRSPGLKNQQAYQWNFGDGSDSIVTREAIVSHRFKMGVDQATLGNVTLKAVGCASIPPPSQEPSEYKPTPLSFRRSAEQNQYTLAGWVPLVLMGLGGLVGAGLWARLFRRSQIKPVQRPSAGPFFLSFPHQENGIQPSASLLNWAQQLQQREESERRILSVNATISQTIRSGGLPTIRYEQIKRRPRYLVLLDDRSTYDQQTRLYGYLTSVLTTRDVDMDVFFFHGDPRYAWSEQYPKGLPIADIYRLYGTHYLTLVTEGNRLLDYDTGEVAAWATEALAGWDNRALLTPVYPQNWHYLEAALSRFFILLPATPDGQLRLRDYFGHSESTPTYEDLLRQFEVLPGTPDRGIFGKSVAKLTVADVEQFLRQPAGTIPIAAATQDWLIQWACATAVFPTPDWAITLAIGKALESTFTIEGLVTTTNLLKLTALPWLRQDTIPEPLRANLLTRLRPEVESIARKTVIDLLNELRPAPGSMAYEERQLRMWEQEFHVGQANLHQLAPYYETDLIKDPDVRQQLHKQHQKAKIRNQYVPLALLLLLILAPLLLYVTPPKTQMASWAVPFYKLDVTAVDSAAYYNNRAVDVFTRPSRRLYESIHEEVTTLLYKSLRQRVTFASVYNLNVARYNLGASFFDRTTNSYGPRDLVSLDKLVSPNDGILTLMRPFKQFDDEWVPDSAITRNYLMLLTTNAPTNSIFRYVQAVNRTSVRGSQNQGIKVGSPINQIEINASINAAKQAFRTPGILEMATTRYVTKQDSLTLMAFKPTNRERDSLVSVEAARAVLYFGGPRQTTNFPIAASISAPPPTAMPTESAINPSIIPDNRSSNVKPATKKTTITKANKRPLAKTPITNYPDIRTTTPSYTQDSITGTNPAQQRPKADSVRDRTASETNPAQTNVAPTTNPLSKNSTYSPVQQQVQQQPVQQELPIAEQIKTLGLSQLSREQAKCTENDVSVQDKTIRSGESVLIPLIQAVDVLDWRCGSTQQRLYSKRPFNYVLIERATNGLIQWTLYRKASPTAK
ncbi:hypothetical protein BH09BAC4_BH09BAC4_21860 [soil metagenome]